MKKIDIKNLIYVLNWECDYPVAEEFSTELFNREFFYVNYKKTGPLENPFKVYSDEIPYDKYYHIKDASEYTNNIRRDIYTVIAELKLNIDKIYIIDSEIYQLSSFKEALENKMGITIGDHFLKYLSNLNLGLEIIPYMLQNMKPHIYNIIQIFNSHEIFSKIDDKMGAFSELFKAFPEIKQDYTRISKAITNLSLWNWLYKNNPNIQRSAVELNALYDEVMRNYPWLEYFYTCIGGSNEISDSTRSKLIEYINTMDVYYKTNSN